MQVKNIVAAALLATASSALPKPPSGEDGILFFQVMAIRPGSAIQYAAFQAARNNLWLKLPHQNASCDRPDENRATFALNNGSLYLYAESETPQELFVDRSGMGTSAPCNPSDHECPSLTHLACCVQAKACSATPRARSRLPPRPRGRAGWSTATIT